MTDPVDKVRKLIALAVGTNAPEEARTTALIAVRLIAEHKMLDAPAASSSPWGSDIWEDIMRKSRESQARREQPPPPPPPEPRYQRYKKPWNHAEHRRAEPPPGCVWITAKFDSKCLHCGKPTRTGESVMWEKGCGVFHEACWPAAEASSKDAPF